MASSSSITMARQHSDYAYPAQLHPQGSHHSQPSQYPFPPSTGRFQHQPSPYEAGGRQQHPYAFPSPADDTPPLSYRSSPAPSPLPPTPQPAPPPLQGTANASRPSNLQITLPAGQTNTLSLKTTQLSIATGTGPAGASTPGLSGMPGSASSAAGSTTLFQKAKAILHHLRAIEGFAETYLTYEPSPELGFEGEHPTAVEHVWSCLRLGSPWVRLVNLVGATGVWSPYLPGASSSRWVPLEGEDPVWEAEGLPALNWGAEQARDSRKVKACQKPLYNALKHLTAILEAGGWPGQTELWRMTAVFGTDTNEAVKIFHTVSLLLDLLPPPPPMHVGRPSISGGNGVYDPLSPVSAYPSGQHFQFPPSPPTGFNPHDSGSSSLGAAAAAMTPGGFMTGIHAIPGAVTPGGAALMGFGGSAAGGGPGGQQAMGEAANLVKELVETERKYIQELEVLHSYAESLVANELISTNTAHTIFSNLHLLLDFQRKFQISLETEAEKADALGWRMGDWGKPFIKHEKDFEVYEPFCANYLEALDTAVLYKDQLLAKPDLILEPVRELPAFLIKPIQRITKYPLLLNSLVKATNDSDYTHHDSLALGLLSVKRITDKVNETSRAKENAATKEELKRRVTDWKGHEPEGFGDLLVDDLLTATKGGSERDYHVFLFERMLLCCKDANDKSNRKSSKSSGPVSRPITAGSGFGKSERTELLLKGRIYVNNLTHTEVIRRRDGGLGLQLYWRSQDAPDTSASFLLHMRNDELLQKWESTVNRLIAHERQERQLARERHARLSPRTAMGSPTGLQPHRRPSVAANSEWNGPGSGSFTPQGPPGSGTFTPQGPPGSGTFTPQGESSGSFNSFSSPVLPRNMSITSAASSSYSDGSFSNAAAGPSLPRSRVGSASNLRNHLPYEPAAAPPMPNYGGRGGGVPISRQESTDSVSNSTSSSIGPMPLSPPACLIRIHYASALHMVKVPRDVDVPELRERVYRKLCRGHPEIEGNQIKLTYQDDDDDWVTLSDNFPAEFREHLDFLDVDQQVELRVTAFR